jgi:hypothetical protein
MSSSRNLNPFQRVESVIEFWISLVCRGHIPRLPSWPLLAIPEIWRAESITASGSSGRSNGSKMRACPFDPRHVVVLESGEWRCPRFPTKLAGAP